MEFLTQLKLYLEANAALNGPIVFPILREGSSIAVRQTPSSPIDRYADNSKVNEFSFQVLVQDASHPAALNAINSIADILDGLHNNELDGPGYQFIKLETYTLPNFLEKTTRGEYVYTAMFTAELEKGGS